MSSKKGASKKAIKAVVESKRIRDSKRREVSGSLEDGLGKCAIKRMIYRAGGLLVSKDAYTRMRYHIDNYLSRVINNVVAVSLCTGSAKDTDQATPVSADRVANAIDFEGTIGLFYGEKPDYLQKKKRHNEPKKPAEAAPPAEKIA